jgi:hypothetical protein
LLSAWTFQIERLSATLAHFPETGAWAEITAQARVACNEIGVRRKEMQIAMSYALALMCWQGFRYLQDFNSRDLFWLLIGVLLAVVTMVVISRRRRRWF